jgi:hypothetical protein
MRGSIRKWMVVGALASASLVFPACSNTNRGTEDTGMLEQTGTGGAGDVGMEDPGIGGSGGTKGGTTGGTKGGTTGTMGADAGTAADAGTGGTGFDNQDVGTSGQGVTGGEGVGTTRTPSGGVPSPGK